MTDRELLEAAAKAAGLVIDKSPYNGGGIGNTGFDVCGNAVLDWYNGTKWNPITDDGDALRLAVKLQIYVQPTGVCAWAARFDCHATEMIGDDSCAATRRAIVRAAAMVTPDVA